jgi:cation diffusion facilitator family transporter
MDACCEAKSVEIDKLRNEHKRVLTVVLFINVILFIVEVIAGLLAHSTALLADSIDMLGDSLVYGFSLYVLWRSPEWKTFAALFKGAVMAVFGLGVLAEAIYKISVGVVPNAETMGLIGILVLLGNGLCFVLLFRHRTDDLNMRSTWLCSRNDIIANVAVLVAAGGVAFLHSAWPDILIGAAIALIFIHSAWMVLAESVREYGEFKLASKTRS